MIQNRMLGRMCATQAQGSAMVATMAHQAAFLGTMAWLLVCPLALRAAEPSTEATNVQRTVRAQVIAQDAHAFFHANGHPVDLAPIPSGTVIEVERVSDGRCFFRWRNRAAYLGCSSVIPVDNLGREIRNRPLESFFPKPARPQPVKPATPAESAAKAGDGTNAPSAQGTTGSNPSSAPAPGQSPKTVAAAFIKAFADGNAAAAKAICLPDPKVSEMIDLMSGFIKATKQFQKAVVAKWGEAAAKKSGLGISVSSALAAQGEALKQAKEETTSDTAKLVLDADPSHPFTLKKVDGKWKVDLLATQEAQPQMMAMMAMYKPMTKAFNDLAAEVAAGKHQTIEQVMLALASKIKPPGQ